MIDFREHLNVTLVWFLKLFFDWVEIFFSFWLNFYFGWNFFQGRNEIDVIKLFRRLLLFDLRRLVHLLRKIFDFRWLHEFAFNLSILFVDSVQMTFWLYSWHDILFLLFWLFFVYFYQLIFRVWFDDFWLVNKLSHSFLNSIGQNVVQFLLPHHKSLKLSS